MTIATIRAVLTARLNALASEHGETTELTAAVNTTVTDSLADTLDDVNPNHQYPPVPKI